MVSSSGVMGGVAVLLGATLPVAMGTTTVAVGLLTAAWSGGWGNMGTATSETWENGIRPALDALGNYLSVTIPGALSTMRVAWERDWAAAAGAIEAVSAAFDGLVARLSRPLPNPAAGIAVPGSSGGSGNPPPASPGGGRAGVAMVNSRTEFRAGGMAHTASRGASEFALGSGRGNVGQRMEGVGQSESGEVVSLLRALLFAVQRQERSVTIELDGRMVGRAMSRQRASSLLYDARS
jgi:phage-related protein